MSRDAQIVLIDSNIRRRAAISHCLATGGVHVEPFEHIAELASRWPRAGMILAHDDGTSIAALMRHMGDAGGWLPVVAFAEAPAPESIVAAVLAGAIHYVAWPFSEVQLAHVLESARDRAVAIGSAKQRESLARGRIERLTGREREVLDGVASGLSNRMIGEKLAISPRTVEIHRANMLNKMGANHTSEAIRIAIEASLVS